MSCFSLTKTLEKRFEVFENKVLRQITGPVYDQDTHQWRRRHNVEIREITGQQNVRDTLRARRLQWAGHVARMKEERTPRKILTAQVRGRRPVGRPRKDWRRCLEEDIRFVGEDPDEWMQVAQDRRRWKVMSRAVMGQQVAQVPPE